MSRDAHGRRDDGERRDRAGRQRGAARSSGRPASKTALAPAARTRTGDRARTAAFDVMRDVADSDSYANLVLPPLLRSRGISGRDAAFATELCYGTLRLRGRYDAVLALVVDRPLTAIDPPVLDLLRLGAHQHLGMRVPVHAAVSETVALARARVGAGAAQFVNAVLRRVTADPWETWQARVEEAAGDDVAARLAAVHSHPVWVVRALHQALVADGRDTAELDALLAADNVAPAVTLVARPGLVDRAALAATLPGAVPGTLTPTALALPGGDPGAVAEVRDGRAGVQDEGSQLVALALAAVDVEGPERRWLDLAAGPGGKAALLGAVAAGRGLRLVATEVQPHRAALVERSVVAVPAGTVEVRCADGRELGESEPAAFDRVLLDAPCTGLGALRRRPEARWRRRPEDLAQLTRLQGELLDSALAAVRPGGVVAYVTCSPHVAETRAVVADALRRHPDVTQLDAREAVRSVAGDVELGDGPAVQLWPHVHGTDAMHLVLLRRS